MNRVLAILSALLGLAAMAVLGAFVWLGFTDSGLQYAATKAREFLPAGIHIGPVHGQLLGAVRVQSITYRDPDGLRVDIAEAELRWRPWSLLRSVVHINELLVRQVHISLPEKKADESPSPGFRFPLAIVIRSAQISDIRIAGGPDAAAWKINSITIAARAHDDQLKIKRINIEADKLSVSATGRVGTLQPFPVELSVDSRWTGWTAPFELKALLAGDLKTLRVRAATPTPYKAQLDGRINNLLDAPAWDATLTLDRAALTPFIANARIRDLTGSLRIIGDAKASTLDASLRAIADTRPPRPVLLDTRFIADAGGFDVRTFDLRSGTNGLHARGTVRDKLDLRVQLAADDIGALLPGLGGKLSGRGTLRGTRERPRVTAKLNGAGLTFGDWRAGGLDLDLSVTDWKRYAGNVNIRARDTGKAQLLLDSLSLRASGSETGHKIQLAAERNRDALDAVVDARLRRHATGGATDGAVDGQLRTAVLRVAGMDWSLEKPVRFRHAAGALNIEETCLAHAGAALCASFDRAGDGAMRVQARTRDASLALLKNRIPGDMSISGALAAKLNAHVAPDGAIAGNLDATLGQGEILYGGKEGPDRIRHDGGKLHARAAGGNLTANLNLQPAPASRIEGDWQMPFDPLRKAAGDAPLSGRLRAELTDLGLLTPFVPDVAAPKGRLTADLQFAGTIAAPRLAGSARLEDGAVGVPRLGIRLDPVRAQVTGTGDGSLHIAMEAHSGGKLELDGDIRARANEGFSARLDVTGKDFIAARLPNLDLTLAPALQFDVRPKLVKINGEIQVPRGRITARKLQDTQTPSKDVVIVGRKEETRRTSDIAVDADVRVRLGDEVRIDVVGVTGRIDGALAIRQKPGLDATGVGELEIRNGRYEGYGQRLDIQRGRLVFAGGVVTDPRFDVRAVRKIQEIEAGIDLTGTVSHPQATLYSDPAMSETDVLSYMMFGRPASAASQSEGSALASAAASIGLSGGEFLAKKIGSRFGIEDIRVENTGSAETTSLVLGTYLTPRLFLQYGVGLFDPVNTLTLRYQLGKRWRVEAESGEAQGGDLLYSIER